MWKLVTFGYQIVNKAVGLLNTCNMTLYFTVYVDLLQTKIQGWLQTFLVIFFIGKHGVNVLIIWCFGLAFRTDFKCSSQSEIGQQLFLKLSVWLIFHNVFPKTSRFSSLVTKPLRIIFWRTFFNFYRILELIHLLNRVFHTNRTSNAAEMLQFEDLAVWNYNF